MQAFMNYFGQDYGFIPCLLFFFPLGVIVFSAVITLLSRRWFLAPIIVALVFGAFLHTPTLNSTQQLATSSRRL
ncbi:hypothetical protein NZD89_02125 [Alicyclobacillus fastidiosus]|uniref:L-lactate permease n=1 Tax=Alicyclobacillus fastidiosus TaxID=392011 RepID=A0ABY6ZJR8_9BACL|nr:hypothetical protein [Alicyclobacillus fastidiosus]WAH42326.1 hypothetical protein NZD89_02125 [Alicyclobacillus fastidiosus]GMA64134.1 hypothetical protein GCM10025859_45740 [Alicyclobacillus fastidiosus]